MSFVGGEYLDYKRAKDWPEGGLSYILGKSPSEGGIKGFVPGEIAHAVPPNAKTQLMIDTPLGKGSGIFFGFLWQMRKKGFHVQKVDESIEISPVHTQYYQITVQQKQTLEGQIKSALAGIQTSISDYELLAHDIRRYREYMNYFENIERGRKEGDEELVRRNNQTLKSIFIDQVDVHTGEGVALKLIASRWPTIIVDFMKIKDDDEDPRKIANDYGFSEAEGVVLATKNKIFKQWRDLFKEAVMSRYKHLKELVSARERSIDEYRNMVKPYVLRHKMIREFGDSTSGRAVLKSFSWWRPATQAVSLDAAEYWIWRPFAAPELHRAPAIRYEEETDIFRSEIPAAMKHAARQSWDAVKDAGFKKLKTFVTGIEPLDDWVWFLKGKLEEYYQKRFGYRATLDIVDVLKARKALEDMYKEYSRWDWIPSPYFMTLEVNTFRVVIRNPDGTEGETFIIGSYPDRPFTAYFDTQNVMVVRMLELRLQEKELERYITDMVGESAGGEEIKKVMEGDYPYLHGVGKPKEEKKGDWERKVKDMTKRGFGQNIRFTRPGPYDSVFMERVAAIMVKNIVQSTYGPAVKYLKSAAGVP